jgi:hypothetical protein
LTSADMGSPAMGYDFSNIRVCKNYLIWDFGY